MQIYSILESNRVYGITDKYYRFSFLVHILVLTVIENGHSHLEYGQNDIQVKRITLAPTFINVDIFHMRFFPPPGTYSLSQDLLSRVSRHFTSVYALYSKSR